MDGELKDRAVRHGALPLRRQPPFPPCRIWGASRHRVRRRPGRKYAGGKTRLWRRAGAFRRSSPIRGRGGKTRESRHTGVSVHGRRRVAPIKHRGSRNTALGVASRAPTCRSAQGRGGGRHNHHRRGVWTGRSGRPCRVNLVHAGGCRGRAWPNGFLSRGTAPGTEPGTATRKAKDARR